MSAADFPKPKTFDVGSIKFRALGDRLIVQEDEFKSGYECPDCEGHGTTQCTDCNGTGVSPRVPEARCRVCEGKGNAVCQTCQGKGGSIIVPDVSQRRPTTGVIVSAGPNTRLHEGQSIMYSNFSGYVIDLERAGRKVTLRVIHESEALCELEGHLDIRTIRGKSDVAVYTG